MGSNILIMIHFHCYHIAKSAYIMILWHTFEFQKLLKVGDKYSNKILESWANPRKKFPLNYVGLKKRFFKNDNNFFENKFPLES